MTPCPLCRTEIPDAEDRCPRCGARVRRDVPAPPTPVAATVPSAPAPPAAPAAAPAAAGGWVLPPQPPRPATPPPAFGAPAAAPAFHATAPAFAPPPNPYAPPPAAPPAWAPPPPTGAGAGVPRPGRRGARKVVKILATVLVALVAVPLAIGFVSGAIDARRADDRIGSYVKGDAGVQYDSAAGGFSAQFPTHPVPQEQTFSTATGRTIVVHDQISRPGRQFAFEVGYIDLDDTVRYPDVRAALAGIVDSMAGAVGGKVTETTPSTLQGMTAEDFVVAFEDHGEDAYVVGRVALSSTRLFLVAVTARRAERDGFTRLVNSFQLTSSMG